MTRRLPFGNVEEIRVEGFKDRCPHLLSLNTANEKSFGSNLDILNPMTQLSLTRDPALSGLPDDKYPYPCDPHGGDGVAEVMGALEHLV